MDEWTDRQTDKAATSGSIIILTLSYAVHIELATFLKLSIIPIKFS